MKVRIFKTGVKPEVEGLCPPGMSGWDESIGKLLELHDTTFKAEWAAYDKKLDLSTP